MIDSKHDEQTEALETVAAEELDEVTGGDSICVSVGGAGNCNTVNIGTGGAGNTDSGSSKGSSAGGVTKDHLK